MKDTILAIGVLKVAIPNIQSMSHEEYALARKDYFGASDSSILCGVNLYKTMDQLIAEKNAKYITKEEKEVGEKAIVRKGYDLEPIILDKAAAELQIEIFKPEDMFKFKDVDGLSVNYDGVTIAPTVNKWVPVEAKLVSKYGEKYYNKTVSQSDAMAVDMRVEGENLEQHIKRKALDAPYGYLAALFDESWTFKLFYIKRDDYVINHIYERCRNNIGKIKRDTK